METITLALFSLQFELSHRFFLTSTLCAAQHAEQGFLVLKHPWMFPLLTHTLFRFPVQVWTGPALFLVRPITAKVWRPLDLGPSPVGAKYFSIAWFLGVISLLSTYFCVFLSVFSSSIAASEPDGGGDDSNQPAFIMAAWLWRRLPHNPLLSSGETTWDIPQQTEETPLTVWPAC